MAEKKELGEIIKTARSRKGLSQQKLADFLYVSRDKISSWENGRSEPVYSEILKLSEVLEVPVASFFPEDDGKVLENQKIDVSSQIKQIDWKISSVESISRRLEEAETAKEKRTGVIWRLSSCVLLTVICFWVPVAGIVLSLVVIPSLSKDSPPVLLHSVTIGMASMIGLFILLFWNH